MTNALRIYFLFACLVFLGSAFSSYAAYTSDLSRLEQHYSGRADETLRQYGYEMFAPPRPAAHPQSNEDDEDERSSQALPMGVALDSYVVNIGDALEVVIEGQKFDRSTIEVNAQGMLLVPDLPPIPAAGRTMAQVRLSIKHAVSKLHNTTAYVSLKDVQRIGVLVIGHVHEPGKKTLSVFHTVLDALAEAGGIQKTGSLRVVKLIRRGEPFVLDLYQLMTDGAPDLDLNLKNGDRIIVPPMGPSFAIAGDVKRPGIYELPPGADRVLGDDLIKTYAGGVISSGKNRYMKLSAGENGLELISDLDPDTRFKIGAGDLLLIRKGEDKKTNHIKLSGHTPREGLYALSASPTLASLLSSEDMLGGDIYPLLGVVKRWNKDMLSHEYFSFPVKGVLNGMFDERLYSEDEVILFSYDKIRDIVRDPDPEEDQTPLIKRRIDPLMQNFLKERQVFVQGAVRHPGGYPVSEDASLQSLLYAAGGLTHQANKANIEITSVNFGEGHQKSGITGPLRRSINFREDFPGKISLVSGDAVRVHQVFKTREEKGVRILGEVVNPGHYDLIPGERFSTLIQRAGGYTRSAYPEGAIFSREQERKAQEAHYKTQAQDITRRIAAALDMDEKKVDSGQIAEARALASRLERMKAAGRITVEADLGTLLARPELDPLLEGGDVIYVPKRTLTVRVHGEVMSPAALQFEEGKKPRDYINEAGGFSYHADQNRSFVLYPDGSAQPLRVSFWNHKATFIPPGSTIIVPRDPKPFDFLESARDISQILSNLAVTALLVEDITDDD